MSFYSSFGRGGRGGFAPRSNPFAKPREVTRLNTQKHPLGSLLHTVSQASVHQLAVDDLEEPVITDCQLVTSYNWLDDGTTTIIVPGKPPRWTPPANPHRLPQDSGDYFRDPNAAKFPSYPMEPVVRAIFHQEPNVSTSNVRLFACGSTLGGLLRFVRSQAKPFRFNVETIGDTVFFVRKGDDPRETIPDIRGYGHTFPEACTTWERDVKNSATHQRVVGYSLAGIRCFIRFECDGYLGESGEETHTLASPAVRPAASSAIDQDLINAFETNSLGRNAANTSPGELSISPGGDVVPQTSIFDLKTRSGKWNQNIDMSDIYPLLWLKQIPNFIVAYHDGAGLFLNNNVHVRNVKNDVQQWESDNRGAIRSFIGLAKKIIEVAKHNPSSLLEVYCPSDDRLEMRKQYGEGTHALPQVLREKWEGKSDDPVYSIDDWETSDAEGYSSAGAEQESIGGVPLKDDSDDSDGELDYTACSAHDCGYCGRCTY